MTKIKKKKKEKNDLPKSEFSWWNMSTVKKYYRQLYIYSSPSYTTHIFSICYRTRLWYLLQLITLVTMHLFWGPPSLFVRFIHNKFQRYTTNVKPWLTLPGRQRIATNALNWEKFPIRVVKISKGRSAFLYTIIKILTDKTVLLHSRGRVNEAAKIASNIFFYSHESSFQISSP